MNVARTIAAVCLSMLMAIAVPVHLAGDWLASHVVSEEGFMAIISPLSADQQMQEEFARSALEDIAPDLPIPQWLRDQAEELLASQVHVITGSEAYAEIWDASMRDLHRKLEHGGQVQFEADLGPAWDSLAEPINAILPFGWEVPLPDSTIIVLTQFDAGFFPTIVNVAQSAPTAAAVAIVSALGALVFAPRRIRALGILGVCLALSGVLSWFVLINGPTFVPEQVRGERFLWPILERFMLAAGEDLVPRAYMMIGGGVAAVVLSIAVAALLAARRSRMAGDQGPPRPDARDMYGV